MKTKLLSTASHANFALVSHIPGMPRVNFAPETGAGSGGEDAAEVAAAAEKATADKAAADAEEARLAKELEDAEVAADAAKDAKILATEKHELLREVMDKKNKLKEAQTQAKAAADALKAFDGIDPAKYHDMVKKEKDAETAAAEARGDFESVKTAMIEEHGKATKTLQNQIDDLTKQLTGRDELINELTVGNDFGASTFIRESLTLTPAKARRLYGTHFEVKDGKTVAYDAPLGAAKRNPLVDAAGNPLVFDEAFKRIIDADPDKETLLKAKVNPGSGSGTIDQKTTEKKKESNLHGVDRIRASFEKQE